MKGSNVRNTDWVERERASENGGTARGGEGIRALLYVCQFICIQRLFSPFSSLPPIAAVSPPNEENSK